MAPETLDEQLVKYLTDARSIERQALAQLRAAPKLADDAAIAGVFEQHLTETEGHERAVTELLEHHGAGSSTLKDIVGTITGAGFGAFAASQPDTPGKLVAHAYAYERMEEATYRLLRGVGERAADADTVSTAREIESQERAMAERLTGCFDAAVEASLRALGVEDTQEQLNKYLSDAHAIESQSIKLLERGPKLAGVPSLASIYAQHRIESLDQQRLIEAELDRRGGHSSALKDAAMRLGALNWGMFFQAQPDTPAKLAAFAYAFEHLEIASYELLLQVARRAGDREVEGMAGHILAQERSAADKVWVLFEQALDASLQDQGVAAR